MPEPVLTDTTSPVVMVDDCVDDILLARLCYRKSGLPNPFISFESAEELLEHLGQVREGQSPMPGIVLLDINMPGLDGFQALEQIRSQPEFVHIPVIMMLTHSDRPEDEQRADALGADGFQTKPYDIAKYRDFFTGLAKQRA